jgi:integrase
LIGLRKGELAAIRYRDFDLGRRGLRVNGEGGRIRHTPIPTEELRQELPELSRRRDPLEHLLSRKWRRRESNPRNIPLEPFEVKRCRRAAAVA